MTAAELNTLLTGISGFSADKVTYHAFPEGEAPALPYICYQETDAEVIAADDENYIVKTSYDIELYEDRRDPTIEGLIETALNNANIIWHRYPEYIDGELMWQVIYEVTI